MCRLLESLGVSQLKRGVVRLFNGLQETLVGLIYVLAGALQLLREALVLEAKKRNFQVLFNVFHDAVKNK